MTRATPRSQARVLRRLFLTLMLRGRRERQGRPSVRKPAMAFAYSTGIFALVGLLAVNFPRETFLFSGCLHSLAFVLVGLNLAATSGSLLFNAEEAEVLLHRPLEPRALLSAKLQSIGLISLALALAMSLCGFFVGARDTPAGWLFVPVHLISLTLEVLFATGFIVLAYNLCLRWFGRERLDNVMTAVQVVVAVSIMLGGQILPRLLRDVDVSALHFSSWLLLFPPVWFSALDVVLSGVSLERAMLVPAVLGVGLTLVVTWLGVARLAATYEEGLETLNEAAPSATRAGGHGRGIARLRRFPLLRLWLRDPVEAAGFRLALAQLGRSRGLKLRVYPMLAQMLVIPLAAFFGGGSQQGMLIPPAYLVAYLGYFLAMLPVLVLETFRLSEDHEAATLFRQAPLLHPAALFHGTRKAVITALCLPGMLLVLLVGAYLLRDKTQLLLVLPGLLLMPVASLLPTLLRLFVPFAEPVESVSRGAKTTAVILGFQLLSGAFAALTGFLWMNTQTGFWWLLLVEVVLVQLLNLGLHGSIRRRGFPEDD